MTEGAGPSKGGNGIGDLPLNEGSELVQLPIARQSLQLTIEGGLTIRAGATQELGGPPNVLVWDGAHHCYQPVLLPRDSTWNFVFAEPDAKLWLPGAPQ